MLTVLDGPRWIIKEYYRLNRMGPMHFRKLCETFRWRWVGPEALQNAVADDAAWARRFGANGSESARSSFKMPC